MFRVCKIFSQGAELQSEETDVELTKGLLHGKVSVARLSNRGKFYSRLLTLINIIIFAISVVFFCVSHQGSARQNAALKATSWFSPVLEDVEIPLLDTTFNGTFLPGSNPSPWRMEPGAEADAAWTTHDHPQPISLTAEQVRKLGKDPSTAVKLKDVGIPDVGDDAYFGTLDLNHQIHCLNVLRIEAFAEFGLRPGSVRRIPKRGRLFWLHLRHCTDIVMQNLLCNGDAGVMTYQWMETQNNPFPDFSVNRKCRDVDVIFKWLDEHTIRHGRFEHQKKPAGVKQVPVEPGYDELLLNDDGEYDHHSHHNALK